MPSSSPTIPQMPVPSINPSTSFSQDRNDSTGIATDEGGGRNHPLLASQDIAPTSSSFTSGYQNISSAELPTISNRSVSSGMVKNYYSNVKTVLSKQI